MWDKIKLVIVTVLATLGVLFVILMLLPDDESEAQGTDNPGIEETASSVAAEGSESHTDGSEIGEENTETEETRETEEENREDPNKPEENAEEDDHAAEVENGGNRVEVNIPDSALSDWTVSFKTAALDGETVTDDIFSDYDITVVHVWATYCDSCIDEMGDYAAFYKELPDNLNFIGIVNDVYDGLDNNVQIAGQILCDSKAEFMNLRISDSIYETTSSVYVLPSTFFVDRNGHVIGGLLEGAGPDDVKKELGRYLK